MTRAVVEHVWLAWRSFALPGVLVLFAVLAVVNVNDQVESVHTDYATLLQTKADYRAHGMDFEADLTRPAHVVTHGDEQSVTNLARFDYDNFTDAVAALAPASVFSETLYFFCFVFFPAIFFLAGLWMSTIHRRYGFAKVKLLQSGTTRAVLGRQLAVVATAVALVAVVLLVELVGRAIGSASVAATLPVGEYPPIGPSSSGNVVAQLALLLLVVALFGGGGITIGTLVGVFALPAIVFLLWDLVIPFLGPGDPRNWIVVLGRSAFGDKSNDGGYHLPVPLTLSEPVALISSIALAIVVSALAYFCIRIRNPLAS